MSTAMSARSTTTVPRPDARAWWLAVLAVLAAAVLFMHGPIPQWPDYHHFADARSWLGLPHAQNVLSNLPFALVGGWGLLRLRRPSMASAGASGEPALAAWRVFAGALAWTAVGSSVYHWAPSNNTLLGDRLPIAWACAALSCAFLAERVDTRLGRRPVVLGAVAAGTGAVLYWWFTERAGAGDLRPYLMVQFLPMLLVPAALLMRLPPAAGPAARVVPGAAWWWVLGLYGLAKLAELADAPIHEALSLVTSGHVLKHLLAAAAAAMVLRAVTSPARAG